MFNGYSFVMHGVILMDYSLNVRDIVSKYSNMLELHDLTQNQGFFGLMVDYVEDNHFNYQIGFKDILMDSPELYIKLVDQVLREIFSMNHITDIELDSKKILKLELK